MPDPFFISINNNQIGIHRFGKGPRLLIVFHGFQESGANFDTFEHLLGNDFTIYAPDLPFHGLTKWNTTYFLPTDLEKLVRELLSHFGTINFSMLGYSMGGRMALYLVPTFISQIDQLVLLAPDGLKKNFWYSFVTRTWLGRRLLEYITYHPALFHSLFDSSFRVHLINESIYKFVKHHTLHEQERKIVYLVWTTMKNIRPDIPKIIRQIRKNNLPVKLFFGRYDRIFPPASGNVLQNIPSVQTKIVESGHQLLNRGVVAEIYGFLNDYP